MMGKRRISEFDFIHYGVPVIRIFAFPMNHHGGRWRSLARAWRGICWTTYRRIRDGHKKPD